MDDAAFVIDGNRFDDIPGFYAEINWLFMASEDWQLGNSLDALDDMLHGGYGALQSHPVATVTWVNFAKSRSDLGVDATRDWLRAKLDPQGGFDRRAIHAQLAALSAGKGPTYFDQIVQIFADHPNLRLIPA